MSHNAENKFSDQLAAARQAVKVGGRYQHFRNQQFYTVVDLAILESTEEVVVVYVAEYGERLKWVRSFANFTEEVAEGVQRFQLAEEKK